jgi:hypothetical protein
MSRREARERGRARAAALAEERHAAAVERARSAEERNRAYAAKQEADRRDRMNAINHPHCWIGHDTATTWEHAAHRARHGKALRQALERARFRSQPKRTGRAHLPLWVVAMIAAGGIG